MFGNLKVEEMWELIFMANQPMEIVGTLLLLKKEDKLEASHFQRTWKTEKRGYFE